jgi:hypothetical protein
MSYKENNVSYKDGNPIWPAAAYAPGGHFGHPGRPVPIRVRSRADRQILFSPVLF